MTWHIHILRWSAPKEARRCQGITGIETAIILIAFVVVSSVFAYATLTTGIFAAVTSKMTFMAGLSQARSSLEHRGFVIAKAGSTGDEIDEIYFQVSNAAGGEGVDLTPGKTIIVYGDTNQVLNLVSGDFTATGIGAADADSMLEPGEIFEIRITGLAAKLNPDLGKNAQFTLEVNPNKGAVLYIARRTPVALDAFNDLG